MKKSKTTKIMSTCLLAVVMLVATVLIFTPKAQAATSDYYTYTVLGGRATITACDTSISGDITIPATLGGYPVTSIGYEAFAWCDNLTSVTIGANVISIGGWAFHDCYNLTNVTISDGVISIGGCAFYNCDSLTSVTIPDSVESIGDDAFYDCYSLTGIWVDENNANYSSDSRGVLFNKDKTTLIQAHGGVFGSYTIPDSVESVEDGAFYDCYSLTSVTIGDSVESIGDSAFSSCYSLTSVTIGDSVVRIGDSAFYSCGRLTDVYYGGTQAQWNVIHIGSENSKLTGATIHYNHVHDYTQFPATTVNATCTKRGYTEYTCIFGETYREVLPALGHIIGDNAVVTQPTCTQQGYTTSTCSLCGATVTTDYVAALGHNYSGPVSTVDPTCTKKGYTGNTCTRCGDVEKKTMLDALGHKMAVVPASDPTCEKPGLSAGTACERCGLVGVAQKETAPALGGSCDFSTDPATCGNCGYIRANVAIDNVVLRPGCSGLYFKGSFTFDGDVTVTRHGIAVSLYNDLPVADDSDTTSLYTIGNNSVLISNILGEGKNGRDLIYARPYALLADGTYIYGEVVCANLKAVVEVIDLKLDILTTAQKTAIADLYRQNTATMQDWLIPKIKELV